jgi:hypothetical protein
MFSSDRWSNKISEFFRISKRTYRAKLMYDVLSKLYGVYNHPDQCNPSLYDKILPVIKAAETQDYLMFNDFKNIYATEYGEFDQPIVYAAKSLCSTEVGSESFYNAIHSAGVLRGEPEKERQMVVMDRLIQQMRINHELMDEPR